MLNSLIARENHAERIRIALIGAGSMGLGIALQIKKTPGMELVVITDIDQDACRAAANAYGQPFEFWDQKTSPQDRNNVLLTTAPHFLEENSNSLEFDVLVESTNTIEFALHACLGAIRKKAHVVLMNAEVDLAFGPLLRIEAEKSGVTVTSDAGDQHGVLSTMIEEIKLWGFDISMAGNIKGFLRRHATASSLAEEARVRNLNPIQCCAYTDGTKLNIEMAVLANGLGLQPFTRGMEGPKAGDVREVFSKFDFTRYGDTGVVDYILGAEPGGGVFVVGRCEDKLQSQYLEYYKLGDGPFYLFYRPYHLCHLETPRAIWRSAECNDPILVPQLERPTDVFSFAKKDLMPGDSISRAIGGDEIYGLIDKQEIADQSGLIPIWLLDTEGDAKPRLKRPVAIDEAITWDDIELPDSPIVAAHELQRDKIKNRHDG